MVVKSATKKKLMDLGVTENFAHTLADDRKWDNVKILSREEIAKILETDSSTADQVYEKIRAGTKKGMQEAEDGAGPKTSVRLKRGARTRKVKTAADLSEYDHDKKMLSFVDPLSEDPVYKSLSTSFVEAAGNSRFTPRMLNDLTAVVHSRGKKKLTKKQAEAVIAEAASEITRASIDPYEAGNHAWLNPSVSQVQMTSRTHYAGVATVNVTQGLPRIIEIVDARKVPQTPTMNIRLKPENSKDVAEAQKLAAALEVTTTVNIATIETDVAQRRLILKLNKTNLKQKKMTAKEVQEKLGNATRLLVKADKEKNASKLTIIPGVHSEADLADLAENPPSYTMLLQLEEKIRDLRLKGVPGIERANVQLEEATGEYYLSTIGSNLTRVNDIEDYRQNKNLHEQYHRNLREPWY